MITNGTEDQTPAKQDASKEEVGTTPRTGCPISPRRAKNVVNKMVATANDTVVCVALRDPDASWPLLLQYRNRMECRGSKVSLISLSSYGTEAALAMLKPVLAEQEARALETDAQVVVVLGNMPVSDDDSTERMIDLIEHARRREVTIALSIDAEGMSYLDQIGRTETYTADDLYGQNSMHMPSILECGLPAMLKTDEVAALSRKSVAQIRKLACKGSIPGAQKLDSFWTFNAQLCIEWLSITEEMALRTLQDHVRSKGAKYNANKGHLRFSRA